MRAARIKAGLSQAALGQPYYTRAMVSAVELGKLSPALKSLQHFAKQSGVKLSSLVPDD